MSLINTVLTALFPPAPEPIRDLRIGTTALCRGIVVARDVMESPLTGEACVYYQYSVEEWRKSRMAGVGGDGFWQLAERDEAIAEFYLQDESDRAIVAPLRARIERSKGVVERHVELGLERRAHQLLIKPGDEIEVVARVGHAHDIFDDRRAYRDTAARVMLHAGDDDELIIRLLAQ